VTKTPPRPITFRAAEDLGAFELAQLWADRTAWPIDERTLYDELSELAVMSALGAWLRRWQPIAIHSAMVAGARPEAVAGALGNGLQVASDRHEWALRQRDFIAGGKPGISAEEHETVARSSRALFPESCRGLGGVGIVCPARASQPGPEGSPGAMRPSRGLSRRPPVSARQLTAARSRACSWQIR